MINIRRFFGRFRFELLFLLFVYLLGLYFRLLPRLQIDPHLLTFNADIWYRLAISQYICDHGHLSQFSIRYLPYGFIPEWYPPVFPYFLAFLAKLFRADLPTVSSRIIPFFESLTPLTFFILMRYLYGRKAAVFGTLALSLTCCFVYWNGICDPQSFISFMLPLIILMWVWYNTVGLKKFSFNKRLTYLTGLGMLLAVSFLTHLMYFLMLIIIFLVNISLIMEKKAKWASFLDLAFAVFISQALTAFWWFPNRLYWWWVNGLVTSTGFTAVSKHLADYGVIAAVLGGAAFLLVAAIYFFNAPKRKPYILLAVFWTIFPLLETQNEAILKAVKRIDLMWWTLYKPLEGFRFHPYLAQPLALCIGIGAAALCGFMIRKAKISGVKKIAVYAAAVLLTAGPLFYDIQVLSKFKARIQNAGINIAEYRAAVWFRENSGPTDRITCDYYRVQMLAGVCGGKAMLGLPFPLRNVDIKYINQKEAQQTRDDIYSIYATPLSGQAYFLMQRYGITHVLISEAMDKSANFGSKFKERFGADVNVGKFKDENLFDIVYNKNGVTIVKAKKQ